MSDEESSYSESSSRDELADELMGKENRVETQIAASISTLLEKKEDKPDERTTSGRKRVAREDTILTIVKESEFDFSRADEARVMQRKCLLLTLQVRMLLREMTEHQIERQLAIARDPEFHRLMSLIAVLPDDGEERDWVADIAELKQRLAQEARTNRGLEKELQKLESKISLLIHNRTSIQEIDRNLKKQLKKQAALAAKNTVSKEVFTNDKKKMEGYANLFYVLQTEPKYLAKVAYLGDPAKIAPFMESMLGTLYGDVFSPREEFLIMELFKMCISTEIKNASHPKDMSESSSIVNTMILTYNKRRQGTEYLKATVGPVIKEITSKDDLNLNIDLKQVVAKLAPSMTNATPNKEDKKKKKDKKGREESMNENPEVLKKAREIVNERAGQLAKFCSDLIERIKDNLTTMPYGLRLVCKQIFKSCTERFPKIDKQEFWKIVGYFVYYRYINLALSQPETFELVPADLPLELRKNLLTVGKILQQAFNFSEFSSTDPNFAMNDWIVKNKPNLLNLLQELINVAEPEEHLQVNKYMELTIRTKPLILITAQEIINTHQTLTTYADQLTTDPQDPIRIVLKDLGPVPDNAGEEGKDIQLYLESKFKTSLEDISPETQLYEETKEIIIRCFKKIPMTAKPPFTLMNILKQGEKLANDHKMPNLQKNISKALENIAKLDKAKVITAEDNYASLLKDISREVANRAEKILQQKKEVERLTAAIKKLQKHGEYIRNQINEYEKYLQGCRENASKKAKDKKKPVKFSHKELSKTKIIEETTANEDEQAKIKYFFSMGDIGKFTIEAKIDGNQWLKSPLELEELLEKKDNNERNITLDEKVTFNVSNLILLLNKSFLS
jgi:Ras GTPase-activating-like protein IQGAP2/3